MKSILCAILLFACEMLFSQILPFKSTIQEQSEYYKTINLKTDEQFDSLQKTKIVSLDLKNPQAAINTTSCNLTKKVFGWHPYWVGNAYTSYQWDLLSDLCYFSYDVSPTTGNNTNTSFAWSTASVVTVAKNNGTKIHICATMFSSHSTFWNNTSAQTTFINTIVSLLNTRGGNGVNIDFEGMGSSDKIPFTTFISNLKNALFAANPNYELSICLPAVDWGGAFNIPTLNNLVDFFTIMGYDYYYSGSTSAGPTSPLYNFQNSFNYTLSKSITTFLKAGAQPSKLLLGLPYYGREWEVSANVIPATTTGNYTTSRTLSYINNTPSTYNTVTKSWDGNCYTPYYSYQNANVWRQCFIDDIYSLGRKYDLVNQRGLGGIGIWALGYDNGMSGYWTLLQDKFTTCAPIVCNDSLFDMGGPARNYYDSESYTYSLSAPTGSLVNLLFKSFNVEQNYDSLFLYNGASINSALIGSYTGTNSPGTVTSTGQNLTLRFKSDGATTTFGFKFIKNCVPQLISNTRDYNLFLDEVLIYPNPTNDKLYFSSEKIKSLRVFDTFGNLILFKEVGLENKFIIDFTSLNVKKGLFVISIQSKTGEVINKKIIYSE